MSEILVVGSKEAGRQKDRRPSEEGKSISPIRTEGRAIARTFWGKAWCDNLEAYSDFENRLPRGRTYVRNGSVIDLQIGKGRSQPWSAVHPSIPSRSRSGRLSEPVGRHSSRRVRARSTLWWSCSRAGSREG